MGTGRKSSSCSVHRELGGISLAAVTELRAYAAEEMTPSFCEPDTLVDIRRECERRFAVPVYWRLLGMDAVALRSALAMTLFKEDAG